MARRRVVCCPERSERACRYQLDSVRIPDLTTQVLGRTVLLEP